MLTTVATFREPWEAHMFCSRLRAEGVAAVVAHEYHVWNNWPLSTALGGVKVQVPEEQEAEAREIERQCRAGEFSSEVDDATVEGDRVTCPSCGSASVAQRRPIPQAAFAIVASFLAGTVWPAWGAVYSCKECGTKF